MLGIHWGIKPRLQSYLIPSTTGLDKCKSRGLHITILFTTWGVVPIFKGSSKVISIGLSHQVCWVLWYSNKLESRIGTSRWVLEKRISITRQWDKFCFQNSFGTSFLWWLVPRGTAESSALTLAAKQGMWLLDVERTNGNLTTWGLNWHWWLQMCPAETNWPPFQTQSFLPSKW